MPQIPEFPRIDRKGKSCRNVRNWRKRDAVRRNSHRNLKKSFGMKLDVRKPTKISSPVCKKIITSGLRKLNFLLGVNKKKSVLVEIGHLRISEMWNSTSIVVEIKKSTCTYTSSTTLAYQPTYTFDEQNKKKKQRRKLKLKMTWVIIIIIIIIPIPDPATDRDKHTPLQNNIHVSKVHCGIAVRFGWALPGIPISVHNLCVFLLYLEG